MTLKKLIYIPAVFDIRLLKLTKYRELIEIGVLSLLSFSIPLLIGHPQILVGTVVNALIVRSALSMKSWKNLPAIVLPSLGALARGVLFGPITVYLLYVVPFIWLGNFVIAILTKWLVRKYSSFFAVFFAAVCKSVAIFIPTYLFVSASILPKLFLTSMGYVQLITAVVGGTIALILTKVEIYISGQNNE